MTIVNNSTDGIGGGLLTWYNTSHANVKNSIIYSNNPSNIDNHSGGSTNITYSNIEGGWNGTGNINIDSKFNPYSGLNTTGIKACLSDSKIL